MHYLPIDIYDSLSFIVLTTTQHSVWKRTMLDCRIKHCSLKQKATTCISASLVLYLRVDCFLDRWCHRLFHGSATAPWTLCRHMLLGCLPALADCIMQVNVQVMNLRVYDPKRLSFMSLRSLYWALHAAYDFKKSLWYFEPTRLRDPYVHHFDPRCMVNRLNVDKLLFLSDCKPQTFRLSSYEWWCFVNIQVY